VGYCGSPKQFQLSLQSDNVGENEKILYNILGFEYFPKALLTTFVAVTLEDWTLLMYTYQDTNSKYLTAIFFIILVIFGSFFSINLVLAEIMNSVTTLKEEERIKVFLEEKK
jgi:hypothetical protein